MNDALLKRLSNADAIASCEQQVRDILYKEMQGLCDEVKSDGLGSMIFHKKGIGPRIMVAAHMDEVGFMVRTISDIGMLQLIQFGGVVDRSKHMQLLRVTTNKGAHILGLLNVASNNQSMYLDIGCESAEEVRCLGIEIGNMVCFASECRTIHDNHLYLGKAMDDRVGCYVLAEALKRMQNKQHASDVYMVATSSEEVGVRGGKTAAHAIDPDIVLAIDVADTHEDVRGNGNQRQLKKGIMIVHYDKTMIPNQKFLQFLKALADESDIPYQCDMLQGGGTDAGNAHLHGSGKLAIVLGVPLRYCHGPYAMVHKQDIENMVNMVVAIIEQMDEKRYEEIHDFLGGQ